MKIDEISDVSCDNQPHKTEKEIPVTSSPDDVENFESEICQWRVSANKFFAIGKTTTHLPPGYYNYEWSNSQQTLVFSRKKVITDDMLRLPDPTFNNILIDFQKFWDNRHLYEKYKYTYKRAYLMYGPAGCGKTSLISQLANELVKKNGIILNITDYRNIDYYGEAIRDVRTIESEKPLIVIIEDIDGYTSDSGYVSKLLNILDGTYQTDNVIIVATTNYPEKLEERFSSRPSRFDVRVPVYLPNPDVRRYYIQSKLKSDDLEKINVDEWIKHTEGFTLDHLKELVLLTFVLENNFDESLSKIKDMLNNARIKPVAIKQQKEMGFNGLKVESK